MQLSTLVKLSLFDWYLFFRCWLLMLLVRVSLSLFKYEKTRSIFQTSLRPEKSRELAQLMIGISIAERRFFRKNCLSVAIAVQRVMASYGYDCSLHMGAGVSPSKNLHAHAWLQYGDKIIVGYYDGIEKLKEFTA